MFDSRVGHNRFGRRTEHIVHRKVYRLNSVGLLEHKTIVAGSLTYNVEGSSFALSDSANGVNMAGIHDHAHSLLAFIANNFFG